MMHMPDGRIVPVSTSLVHAGTFVLLMLPDTDRMVRLHDSGLELLRLGSVRCFPGGLVIHSVT